VTSQLRDRETPQPRHWPAVTLLFLVATAWGASFTVVKDILGDIAPEPFIFLRFTLAGIVLAAIAIARGGLPRATFRPGLILGVLVFVGYWCQTRGLMVISPSRSAFLTGLYVVLVPFCDRLLYRARIDARAWIGSALAVIGTTMLIGGFDARPSWGDALTFVCAICFAMHVVLSAKYSAETSALALAAVQVLVVGIAAAPPSLFTPRPRMTPAVIGVIVFTAIVTTALAFVALMWGQARVTATEAAVMLAFEPVAASFTSILLGREPVTPAFLAGGAIILAAMILSQLPEKTQRDPIAP
jgi:drug/metabolite transporter (DMT)-like permease